MSAEREPTAADITEIIRAFEEPQEGHHLAQKLERTWPLIKAALLAYRPPGEPDEAAVDRVRDAIEKAEGKPKGTVGYDRVARAALAVMPAGQSRDEWRCFHCGEIFTEREDAADHFGVQIDGLADEPACVLNGPEKLLAKMLREAHQEIRTFHEECDAHSKNFYALGAKHTVELQRQEEKGYARGLQDAEYAKTRDEVIEECAKTVALYGAMETAEELADHLRSMKSPPQGDER